MAKYFKITNAEENHYGFQYTDGLNVLEEPFNDNPNDTCGKGGFYFTTIDHIHKFYSYGIYLREVFLPENDLNFKIIMDGSGHKWRANKIILGKKYSLLDLETYKLFGLNMNENIYILKFACTYEKNIGIEYVKRFFDPIIHSSYDLARNAAIFGNTDILDYLVQLNVFNTFLNRFSIHKLVNILISAAEHNQTNIFKWVKKNNLLNDSYIYSGYILAKYAAGHGNIEILQILKDNITLSATGIITVSSAIDNGHLNVLIWCKTNNLKLEYNKENLLTAVNKNYNDMVLWLLQNELNDDYMHIVFNTIIINKNKNMLDVLKNNGIEVVCLLFALICDSTYDMLNFIKENDLLIELDISSNTRNKINYITILQWIKTNNVKIKYSERSLINISLYGDIDILDYLKNNGLITNYPPGIIKKLVQSRVNDEILKWWTDLLSVDGMLDIKYFT